MLSVFVMFIIQLTLVNHTQSNPNPIYLPTLSQIYEKNKHVKSHLHHCSVLQVHFVYPSAIFVFPRLCY